MNHKHTLLSVAIMASLSFVTQAGAQESTDTGQAATELDTVTVTGYRASLEKSLAVKRAANAVVDAISAEDIGKFPDTNAAESLSHLPGISVDRQFGEGEKVSINGTDPALNRVLVNGQTIASGDWGGNPTDTSGRTFNYTLLSPEIIGLMEVYKSPEARIDEGSIGGTVIVHTRKPLDLPANTIRGSLGYSYNDRSDKSNPRGSFLYSWKNQDDTFGFLASVTHDKQDISRAGIEYWGYTTYNGYKMPVGISSSYFQQQRQRDGAQIALQWKPNDRNEFNLTGIYIKGKYNNYSEARYVCPACSTSQISSYTTSNGYITSATVSGDAYAQLDANYRVSEVKTKSLNLRHDYYGDSWVFTTQAGTTSASGGKDPEYLMKYLLLSGGYSFAYNGKSSNVSYDDGSASNWGLTTGTQAGGIYYSVSDDREKYFQFDATRDIQWGPFNKLQLGYKHLDHDNSNNAWGNAIYADEDVTLTEFSPGTTPSNLFDGLNASGDLVYWSTANLGRVLAYLKSLPPGTFHPDYSSSFDVKELTNDVYAQLDFEAGKFRGNVGLRYVYTLDKSNYWLDGDNDGTYQLAHSKTHYYKPLPSFNIAYDLTDEVVLRFGASKVIARPRYGDLAGAVSLDDTTMSGSGGNPNLKPYESNNFDLAAEWYINKASALSGEVFYRDIGSYIVNVTTEQTRTNALTGVSGTYSITSPVNYSGAKVKGASLAYQQSLGYGFGFQVNYTYADADTQPGLNLPYLSKNTYNVIPYWEYGPFTIRINYSYRSEYFTQVGRLNSQVFTDSYKELGLSAAYQINDRMSVNFNASNLLDSTYYWYSQVKYAPLGVYKSGRFAQLTFNFKF
ncbi:MAG: TonB-dependent receptor [Pseudoxanthomonas sp.]